jgi:hypothetical protein
VVSRHLALGRDGKGIYAGAGFDLSWNRHEIDPIGPDAGSEMIKAYADPSVAYQNAPEDVSQNNDIEAETVRCLADLMLAQRIPI